MKHYYSFILFMAFLLVGCHADNDSGVSSNLGLSVKALTGSSSLRKDVSYTFTFNISTDFLGIDGIYSIKFASNKSLQVIYNGVTYDGNARIQLPNSAISTGSIDMVIKPTAIGSYDLQYEFDIFHIGEHEVLNSGLLSFQSEENSDLNQEVSLTLQNSGSLNLSQMSDTDDTVNKYTIVLNDDHPYNTYSLKVTYTSGIPPEKYGFKLSPWLEVIDPTDGLTIDSVTDVTQKEYSFLIYVKPGFNLSELVGTYNFTFELTRQSDGLVRTFDIQEFKVVN